MPQYYPPMASACIADDDNPVTSGPSNRKDKKDDM